MTINMMRCLDYWFGIPLCFFLSLVNSVFGRTKGRQKEFTKTPKVLFIGFSEMGSAILSWPAMKKVKEQYSDCELFYWIFTSNQDAVRVLVIVPEKNIITLRTVNVLVFISDLLRNLMQIWKEKVDVVVDLELFSRFSSIVAFLSKAPLRVGFHGFTQKGLYRGNLHTHEVIYNPYTHISRNFISLVESFEADADEIPKLKKSLKIEHSKLVLPKLKSTDEKLNDIWDRLRNAEPAIHKGSKIVVMHPSVSEALPLRRWDFDNYFKLAEKVLADPDVFVVMVGSLICPLEESIAKRIKIPRMIDFIGKTTLQELLDLFNISRILVSHDGGMIHIASLTEIQIIALFGPETPVLYAPLTEKGTILYKKYSCSPCLTAYNHRLSRCTDNKCLQAITVEEVQKVICERMA